MAEMMTREERKKLLWLIQTFAVLKPPPGELFTLANGSKTGTYIDIKRASMHRDVQFLLARHLYDALLNFWPDGDGIDAVAGVVLGGCQLASMTASYAAGLHSRGVVSPLDVLFIRKERSEHGLRNFVEGPVLKGLRVVVLEDVVSTGESTIRAAGHLRDVGCEVQGALAIVDRRRERPDTLSDGMKIRSLFTIDEFFYGEGAGRT